MHTQGLLHITKDLFKFSQFKLVNELSEFLLDAHGAIATCGQGFMYYPRILSFSGTSLSTLVVRIARMRPDNLIAYEFSRNTQSWQC